LNKVFYDDSLVASNKQQIQCKKLKKQPENSEMDSSYKRARIRPKYSASIAFSWREDKDETNKQNNPFWMLNVKQESREY